MNSPNTTGTIFWILKFSATPLMHVILAPFNSGNTEVTVNVVITGSELWPVPGTIARVIPTSGKWTGPGANTLKAVLLIPIELALQR